MPLVIEISAVGDFAGKPHVNVFHVIEDTGLVSLDLALDVFENTYLPALAAIQSNDLVWSQLQAKPLDILDNRTPVVRPINIPGTRGGTDWMPGGNHIWTVFDTPGIGLKAGGKLIGGLVEDDFTSGEPQTSLLDTIEAALNVLQTLLSVANFFLAVFRPTFSVPGVPTASVVSAILTRSL